MNSLIVPLAAITPEGITVNAEVPVSVLHPADATDGTAGSPRMGAWVVPTGTLCVQGTLSQQDKEYAFIGSISGTFAHECDRCLDSVNVPFQIEVWLYFRQGAPMTLEEEAAFEETDQEEDAEIVYGFTGHEINLGPAIREELILATPTKVVCREECAGLCPVCGVNLNRETCDCSKNRTDASENDPVTGGTPGTGRKPMETKGLAGLGDLFPNLKPTNSEE